jgi:DNA primase
MAHDRMDDSEWLAAAQAVDVGHKQKLDHLCGPASLVVYNNVDSWTAWCWRCGGKGWKPKPEANMQERLARIAKRNELDAALERQVSLPIPASFDLSTWTPAARLWLYRAGLGPDLIARLGAYYHEPTGRVVLPVRDSNGDVTYWQARNPEFPAGGPKYLSANRPRELVHVAFGNSRTVVLCEDILSAWKIGMSGAATGYCVMGTKPGQHTLSWLLDRADHILGWFDPDAAGARAYVEVRKQLALVGLLCTRIESDRDPKGYDLSTIRSIINESRHHPVADHEGPQAVLSAAQDDQCQGG